MAFAYIQNVATHQIGFLARNELRDGEHTKVDE